MSPMNRSTLSPSSDRVSLVPSEHDPNLPASLAQLTGDMATQKATGSHHFGFVRFGSRVATGFWRSHGGKAPK